MTNQVITCFYYMPTFQSLSSPHYRLVLLVSGSDRTKRPCGFFQEGAGYLVLVALAYVCCVISLKGDRVCVRVHAFLLDPHTPTHEFVKRHERKEKIRVTADVAIM